MVVAAKAKVAQLKITSIPRLELQSAVTGTNLAEKIKNIKRLKIEKSFCWTDSKTVLQWLHMDPKRLRPFVMFRVADILEKSRITDWKWVPTKQNPADMATRASNSLDPKTWLHGPKFLQRSEESWPSCNDLGTTDDRELKHRVLIVTKTPLVYVPINFEYFSDWRRLYRAVAVFIRYITRRQLGDKNLECTTEILTKAKNMVIKQAQLSSFEDEIKSLQQQKVIHKKSVLIAWNVYLSEQQILKVQGRSEHLNSEDAIVLPTKHYLTFLIVRDFHNKNHHVMHETAINLIRAEYFILRLRAVYKKVRRECQHCRNACATPIPPQMAPVPAARMAKFERPFTYVGVDYFGPLYVTIGRRTEKRYGVIFTCLTVRAVHLEVAHTLDASSCMMALHNFMSRRGIPKQIYSDNGTNFKAVKRLLREENTTILSDTTIKWNFNPPATPHMGGIWERLVRSVKDVMASMTPSMKFTEESLKSTLCEIEFILNSRPLTFVSLDADDDEALTPNHLLLGSSNGNKPNCDVNTNLRQRWRNTQAFADRFWQRWVLEYSPVHASWQLWRSSPLLWQPVDFQPLCARADRGSVFVHPRYP